MVAYKTLYNEEGKINDALKAAHPAGGVEMIRVPNGEGVVEDLIERQLQTIDKLIINPPTVRKLAKLAGELGELGFINERCEIASLIKDSDRFDKSLYLPIVKNALGLAHEGPAPSIPDAPPPKTTLNDKEIEQVRGILKDFNKNVISLVSDLIKPLDKVIAKDGNIIDEHRKEAKELTKELLRTLQKGLNSSNHLIKNDTIRIGSEERAISGIIAAEIIGTIIGKVDDHYDFLKNLKHGLGWWKTDLEYVKSPNYAVLYLNKIEWWALDASKINNVLRSGQFGKAGKEFSKSKVLRTTPKDEGESRGKGGKPATNVKQKVPLKNDENRQPRLTRDTNIDNSLVIGQLNKILNLSMGVSFGVNDWKAMYGALQSFRGDSKHEHHAAAIRILRELFHINNPGATANNLEEILNVLEEGPVGEKGKAKSKKPYEFYYINFKTPYGNEVTNFPIVPIVTNIVADPTLMVRMLIDKKLIPSTWSEEEAVSSNFYSQTLDNIIEAVRVDLKGKPYWAKVPNYVERVLRENYETKAPAHYKKFKKKSQTTIEYYKQDAPNLMSQLLTSQEATSQFLNHLQLIGVADENFLIIKDKAGIRSAYVYRYLASLLRVHGLEGARGKQVGIDLAKVNEINKADTKKLKKMVEILSFKMAEDSLKDPTGELALTRFRNVFPKIRRKSREQGYAMSREQLAKVIKETYKKKLALERGLGKGIPSKDTAPPKADPKELKKMIDTLLVEMVNDTLKDPTGKAYLPRFINAFSKIFEKSEEQKNAMSRAQLAKVIMEAYRKKLAVERNLGKGITPSKDTPLPKPDLNQFRKMIEILSSKMAEDTLKDPTEESASTRFDKVVPKILRKSQEQGNSITYDQLEKLIMDKYREKVGFNVGETGFAIKNSAMTHPTLISRASFIDVDAALSSLSDFVWPGNNGPIENLLRMVDFGLFVMLPLPTNAVVFIASLYGYDLQTLGRHMDKWLGLKDMKDLANKNVPEAVTKITGATLEEQQAAITSNGKSIKTSSSSFSLTANAIISERIFIKQAKLPSRNLAKLRRMLGRSWKGSLILGLITFITWAVKAAGKATGLFGAGAKAGAEKTSMGIVKKLGLATAVQFGLHEYTKDYDPNKDYGNLKFPKNMEEYVESQRSGVFSARPKTRKGKLEVTVDKLMMQAMGA